MDLTGAQQKVFADAICSAFDPDEFEQLITYHLDKSLYNLAAPGPFPNVVFDVIGACVRRNEDIEKLIDAVRSERPNHKGIQDCIASLRETPNRNEPAAPVELSPFGRIRSLLSTFCFRPAKFDGEFGILSPSEQREFGWFCFAVSVLLFFLFAIFGRELLFRFVDSRSEAGHLHWLYFIVFLGFASALLVGGHVRSFKAGIAILLGCGIAFNLVVGIRAAGNWSLLFALPHGIEAAACFYGLRNLMRKRDDLRFWQLFLGSLIILAVCVASEVVTDRIYDSFGCHPDLGKPRPGWVQPGHTYFEGGVLGFILGVGVWLSIRLATGGLNWWLRTCEGVTTTGLLCGITIGVAVWRAAAESQDDSVNTQQSAIGIVAGMAFWVAFGTTNLIDRRLVAHFESVRTSHASGANAQNGTGPKKNHER